MRGGWSGDDINRESLRHIGCLINVWAGSIIEGVGGRSE